MSPQNARFADLIRALRGTTQERVARELLHALRKERESRKRIERLRKHQSGRLYEIAHEAAVLKHGLGAPDLNSVHAELDPVVARFDAIGDPPLSLITRCRTATNIINELVDARNLALSTTENPQQ